MRYFPLLGIEYRMCGICGTCGVLWYYWIAVLQYLRYTTDAAITFYGLRILEDDRDYFPVYNAVLVYRADWSVTAPGVVMAIKKLEGNIPEQEMVRMNSRVKLEGASESE